VIEIVLIGALVVAIATVVVAVVFALRIRSDAERRVKEAAGRFAGTLGGSGEIAASLDPDEVVRRILDAVEALPGVDAVLLDALSLTGERTRNARGVSDEEAERVAMETPVNSNLRAMDVVYRYRLDDADRAASFLRAGLVVPLASEGRQIGTLAAFTRAASTEFPGETVAALERLALRAGPALDNAHRFVQARLLADVDSLTGLQNRRRFHELLANEVARANRYERSLALIVFDLDNFKAINDQVGHLFGDLALAEVAKRVQSVVRSVDIACRVGGDEFSVIMPESGLTDAQLIADRIARTVAERPLAQGHTLQVSAGVAELKADDDPNELFERADEALYRAKQGGKGRTVAAGE
jgi:diguanylate cyclase (GGDEF)-like protein